MEHRTDGGDFHSFFSTTYSFYASQNEKISPLLSSQLLCCGISLNLAQQYFALFFSSFFPLQNLTRYNNAERFTV
jgi:hypothetical protein